MYDDCFFTPGDQNMEERICERSIPGYVFFCLGVVLWLAYGIVRQDIPVIATNLATLVLASTLLFFKLKHNRTIEKEKLTAESQGSAR